MKPSSSAPSGKGGQQRQGSISQDVTSSSFEVLDVTTPRGRRHFRRCAAEVKRGMALVAPVYDAEGFILGETVFKISDSVEHKDGLYVEVQGVASSRREARHGMRKVKGCKLKDKVAFKYVSKQYMQCLRMR